MEYAARANRNREMPDTNYYLVVSSTVVLYIHVVTLKGTLNFKGQHTFNIILSFLRITHFTTTLKTRHTKHDEYGY